MRRISATGIALLVVTWLVPAAIADQKIETQQASSDVTAMEKNIARELGKEYSTPVVEKELNTDRTVIEKAAAKAAEGPERASYPSGDSASRLAWTWYLLRVGKDSLPPQTELTEAMVETRSTKLGRLIVKSTPDGADIFVDEIKWPIRTKAEGAQGFADVGMRRVRVIKPRLAPAERECEIERDQITTFSAKLRVSGSEAVCE